MKFDLLDSSYWGASNGDRAISVKLVDRKLYWFVDFWILKDILLFNVCRKINFILSDSPYQNASNGGKFTFLGSVDKKIFQFKEFSFYLR